MPPRTPSGRGRLHDRFARQQLPATIRPAGRHTSRPSERSHFSCRRLESRNCEVLGCLCLVSHSWKRAEGNGLPPSRLSRALRWRCGGGGGGARDLFARQELPATTRPAGPSHFSAVRTWPLRPLSRPWPLRPLSRPWPLRPLSRPCWPVYPIELIARHPQHRAAGSQRPWRAQMLMRLPFFRTDP